MAKNSNLVSMSVEDLLKLRDDVTEMLERRAVELRQQLSRLTDDKAKRGRPAGRRSGGQKAGKGRKGGKVAPKYRGPNGETWSGRGLKPRWLSEALQSGARAEDFLIVRETAKKPAKRGRPGSNG